MQRSEPRKGYHWTALLPPAAGLVFGLTLARALWETWPVTFLFLGAALLPNLALGLVCAAGFWAVWRWLDSYAVDFLPFALLLIALLAPEVDLLRTWALLAGAWLLFGVFWLRRLYRREHALGVQVRRRAVIGALVVGLGVFGVYLATLGRCVGAADTFEFQVTAPVLGIAHPTGYPLYVMLGKLTSLVPFGSMAWRVNLSAALPAALAALLLADVIRRLEIGRLLAALAALALAFSATFWSQAVEAEVYALNALFVVIILGILVNGLYVTDPRFGGGRAMRPRRVFGLALAFGFGLTNHLTIVLLAPAAALMLWMCRPRLTLKQWGAAAVCLAAPLLIYLYLPLRWPALHDGAGMPFDEFIMWITGQRFGGALMFEYFSQPDRWMTIFRLVIDQFGIMGLLLAVVGLARLARWFPGVGIVTLVAYGAYFAYALVYIIPDIAVFLIPMHVIQVIWIAYAVHAISEWAPKLVKPLTWDRLYVPLHTALALLPLALLWSNGAALADVPQKGRALEEWGRYVLGLPLDGDSVVLADSEKIAPLEYLHRIEGVRPDMQMVVLGNEALYRQVLGERLAAGQTVYLARYLPGLEGVYHLRSAGPLVEVGTEPLTEPPGDVIGLDITFGGWARLLGYRVDAHSRRIGDTAHVTLYWRREGEATGRHQVWLRLLDAEGYVVWEQRDRFAVNNAYPANAWKEGEIIPDYHAVIFEHGMLPGMYVLEVGMFEPFAAEGLPITSLQLLIQPSTDGEGKPVETSFLPEIQWAGVTAFNVALADEIPPPPVEVRHILTDDLLLLGYDLPDGVTEGEAVLGKFYLQAVGDIENPSVYGGLGGSSEAPLKYYKSLPALPARTGLVVELALGTTLKDKTGFVGAPSGSDLLLPLIAVRPAPPDSLANYAGRALLLDGSYSADTLAPGDLLNVYLMWEALQPFDADYTVFVQLVGPDGRPHGQSDAFPVQGTYPTGQWKVGERIGDAYQLRVDADAPPGRYEIHLGFYLLATGERLPVVDETGAPVANRYILGTIQIVGR
ncbi:MAG: DUF2723 domain-containing protein [Anaerolineae bacterium]|nr:DUF2723 domain-containing protein [Anaerolineae bacterium]